MAQRAISKKRQVVAQGIFKAELNDFFQQELCENGYSGCDVNELPTKKQIVVRATNTKDVVGHQGRRINELTSLVCKRFGLPENKIEIFAEAVPTRGLCAIAQAENLKFKLIQGLAARRAAYGVLRQVMGSGAKGCEVIISGKLRAARAKSMKFTDGFMIHSGQPTRDYIDVAVRHVMLRQGVLGVKVKIMLDFDPEGRKGPNKPLPDHVVIHDPKDDATHIEAPIVIGGPKHVEENVLEQQFKQMQNAQMSAQSANLYGMAPVSTNVDDNVAADFNNEVADQMAN